MGQWLDKFKIDGKVAIITGGAGLIGIKHAEAVIEGGGIPVLLDIDEGRLRHSQNMLYEKIPGYTVETAVIDITSRTAIESLRNDSPNYLKSHTLISNTKSKVTK